MSYGDIIRVNQYDAISLITKDSDCTLERISNWDGSIRTTSRDQNVVGNCYVGILRLYVTP
jgi:hypothetical protein